MKNIHEKLRSLNVRVTPIRARMFALLSAHKKPFTAKEIQNWLKRKRVNPNKSTIYRELDFLTSENIIQSVELGDRQRRYEISGEHHHHIVCVKCKKINEVRASCHLEKTAGKIARTTGFTILNHSLEFFGLCRKCQ